MIWSAIVFYRNGQHFSVGLNLHTLTFLLGKARMVSCYMRNKVDIELHRFLDLLTHRFYHRVSQD